MFDSRHAPRDECKFSWLPKSVHTPLSMRRTSGRSLFNFKLARCHLFWPAFPVDESIYSTCPFLLLFQKLFECLLTFDDHLASSSLLLPQAHQFIHQMRIGCQHASPTQRCCWLARTIISLMMALFFCCFYRPSRPRNWRSSDANMYDFELNQVDDQMICWTKKRFAKLRWVIAKKNI